MSILLSDISYQIIYRNDKKEWTFLANYFIDRTKVYNKIFIVFVSR